MGQLAFAFLFAAFFGWVIGLLLMICHLKRSGGIEHNQFIVNGCRFFFLFGPVLGIGSIFWTLIYGKAYAPDVAMAIGLTIGIVVTYGWFLAKAR